MCKDYRKYCHPETDTCTNGVSIFDFMGDPVIDPIFWIIFLVGYCEITFAMNGHATIKIHRRQLLRFGGQSMKPTEA